MGCTVNNRLETVKLNHQNILGSLAQYNWLNYNDTNHHITAAKCYSKRTWLILDFNQFYWHFILFLLIFIELIVIHNQIASIPSVERRNMKNMHFLRNYLRFFTAQTNWRQRTLQQMIAAVKLWLIYIPKSNYALVIRMPGVPMHLW